MLSIEEGKKVAKKIDDYLWDIFHDAAAGGWCYGPLELDQEEAAQLNYYIDYLEADDKDKEKYRERA